MNATYKGSCLCNTIKFEIEGDFEKFFLCHCEYCRKDTGSAHAANLFSSTAKLQWISGEDNVTRFNLSGTRHSKCFCSICGSALPRVEANGAMLIVPAGCLDSKISIRPNAHLFVASKASWDDALEMVPMLPKFPE